MQDSTPFQVYNASAGSGKTFTLVKEYLKILLLSADNHKFQQILAITFTNKAAGEMKERVIKNLQFFSNEVENNMLEIICKETNLAREVVFKRSKAILNSILQNYSALSITTIDSFTHKLIRTFAYDLRLPMRFEVEMNAESLLHEAVDIVISKIGLDKNLTELLVGYSLQKLDDDKSWDISIELKKFAKIILNENHASHLVDLEDVSSDTFLLLRKNLLRENKNIETEYESLGLIGLNLIKENSLEFSNFSYSELPRHFEKLTKLRQLKPEELKFQGRLNKSIVEDKNLYTGTANNDIKERIDSISGDLQVVYNKSKKLHEKYFGTYLLNALIIDSLIPLAVLNYINVALQELKTENNILLNAEFNKKINETIKNEPAPFIYERLGERFRHYFIDEMQDTSILQWHNIIPLVDHAISSLSDTKELGSLMLVGDAKQSIYRWRGGKAEQFISLSSTGQEKSHNPFYTEKTLHNLETNFRSFTEIIQFNNSFFKHIARFLKKESYQQLYCDGNSQGYNENIGGYVELSFVDKPKNQDEKALLFPQKALQIIRDLDGSFERSELCILVRTKAQGVEVSAFLAEHGIEIISSETLLLKNNVKVNFVINLLYILQYPLQKEYKIQVLLFLIEYFQSEQPKHSIIKEFIDLTNHEFFKNLQKFEIVFENIKFSQSSFYDGIEYIIRSFKLAEASDSYVQFFLDFVFEYQQKKQFSIDGFLDFWELKKEGLSVVAPEAKNSVRIMTIHKSKGLEFPVVIFPYDLDIYRQVNPKIWYSYDNSSVIKSILINYNNKLKYIGEQGMQLFEKRRAELELDNFNLLYVTLTRAIEHLYIVSEKRLGRSGEENMNYYSGFFINYLKEIDVWDEEKEVYSFGDKNRIKKEIIRETTAVIQENFVTNPWTNHDISIVTNSSSTWDTHKGEAINFGVIIHEIMSKIRTEYDVSEIVNQYLYNGTINAWEKQKILKIIQEIINHKELKKYYAQNVQILNEREILTSENTVVIPDRLVIENNKATIIDYKTGKPDKKHHRQLEKYGIALENLGYSINKKVLVYISEELLIEQV
jgi:ATP-dependent exoDNAse (exonuclease V) beta subunit